jgi:tRNA nucleotidyltransferase (CCA-adding enzyme)
MISNLKNLKFASDELASATKAVCQLIHQQRGRALLVGGCVRDALLGHAAKDVDIEVYGIAPANLLSILDARFRLDLVGESFGVIKVKGVPIDISIPRRESKVGLGHKGFEVMSDPHMAIEEAARRRDFTINSMAFDLVSSELVDPYGGEKDLRARVLRHTSEQFAEDPLRVLRAMQFAARFEFSVAPETVEICRGLRMEELPPERVFEEWKKLVTKGRRPSLGLHFLRDCGWTRNFPELEALIGCEQDPEWHPEGDVWIHTLHVMDAFAEERTSDEWEDLVVGLACLCHDLGKPAATSMIDGRICAHGHEPAGVDPTQRFLARMTNEVALVVQVLPLVAEHLKPTTLFEAGAGKNAIRRLAVRVGRIDRLVRVARADQKGRPPKPFNAFPAGDWLLEQAKSLNVTSNKPVALIMGRHLIQLGLKPGPEFSKILEDCFEAQLDGHISSVEEGMNHVRTALNL